MRTGHAHLFIPGPTNVPEPVRRAMNVPMQDMRAPDFGDLTLGLFTDLKRVFRTETGTVMMFPGSGTGAWEAAITNTLNPGDRVLMARYGQFSTLWVEMAQRLGLQVECIDVPWGAGCPVKEFARRLGADRYGDIKAVFVTHNETATGVVSDVAAVRRALDECFHDALLFVDGVSSIGSARSFRMDDWGVDLAVTGSQKGLMLPAGWAFLPCRTRRWRPAAPPPCAGPYFEFADQVRDERRRVFSLIPRPRSCFTGCAPRLDLIHAEGLDAVIARHHRLADRHPPRRSGDGAGAVAEHRKFHSDTVFGHPGAARRRFAREVLRIAHDRYNASFGSASGRWRAKVFRIDHLGSLNEGMCLTASDPGRAVAGRGRRGDRVRPRGRARPQAWYSGATVAPFLRVAAE